MTQKGTATELGNQPIGKLLTQYAIPAIIAMTASSLYNMVDSIFIGHGVGAMAISGIKVLVKVSVDFHELYGYSLTVTDIDPTYTLGDMALRRKEILKRLDEEGVLTLNKELELPELTQRIAVISSATAAGYGDFCNQLENNAFGFAFHSRLFPAVPDK
jgi:exonuclease VII large subunit